jgi:hypothetical protein
LRFVSTTIDRSALLTLSASMQDVPRLVLRPEGPRTGPGGLPLQRVQASQCRPRGHSYCPHLLMVQPVQHRCTVPRRRKLDHNLRPVRKHRGPHHLRLSRSPWLRSCNLSRNPYHRRRRRHRLPWLRSCNRSHNPYHRHERRRRLPWLRGRNPSRNPYHHRGRRRRLLQHHTP